MLYTIRQVARYTTMFFICFCFLLTSFALPLSCEKAEEAVSPKVQMTMNTGNFLSSVEIFIISPYLFFAHTSDYASCWHQACQTKTVNNITELE